MHPVVWYLLMCLQIATERAHPHPLLCVEIGGTACLQTLCSAFRCKSSGASLIMTHFALCFSQTHTYHGKEYLSPICLFVDITQLTQREKTVPAPVL
jgi:hypothetical protein